MEEQSPEEMSSSLEPQEPNSTDAAENLAGEKRTKPEAETSNQEVEETEVTEEEEEVNTRTAEIHSEAAVVNNPADEQNEDPDVDPHVGEHLCYGQSSTDQKDVEQTLEESPLIEEPEAPKPESLVEEDQQCAVSPSDLKLIQKEQQELLQELQAEQDRLFQLNYQLQSQLAHHFKKATNRPPSGREQTTPEQNEHYQKCLDMMEDLKTQENLLKQQVEELHRRSHEKLEQVEHEQREQTSTRREVIITAVTRAKGKTAARAEAERLQGAEEKRQDELVSVRLQNIKLQASMNGPDGAPGARRALSEGLHRIDLEQLKMENQTYSEKIEERNEELHKLKKKINNTVQILTHMKEKLQFVQAENKNKQTHLSVLNATLQQDREALTKTKQAREVLASDNLRLRQQCGMLGNTTLLRDLEDTEDEREALERRVEALKSRHAQTLYLLKEKCCLAPLGPR